jgi:hypothetical protein
MAESEASVQTVTVHVWEGPSYASADDLIAEQDPDEYELEPVDPYNPSLVSDSARALLADDIENHRTYAFHVPNDERPATVNVCTNDSYHNVHDWGDPIERGLTFHEEDDHGPFKCEAWGRIMMYVEPVDSED